MSPSTSWRQPVVDSDRPTARQLAYLRALADRAGQTFSYPRTRRQASAQISRLRAATPTSHDERRIERCELADAIAYGPADAARIDVDHELTGVRTDRPLAPGRPRDRDDQPR